MGEHFGLCSNPEFLREGTSLKDFAEPPFTLIGASDDRAAAALRVLYAGVAAPIHVTPIRVAEAVKYVCNCFHGLKVSFANEIGSLCKAMDIDSHEVMRLVCEDKKLNISPAYLRPGFAFGGSCLPKDLRALVYRGKQLDVETPCSLPCCRATSSRSTVPWPWSLPVAPGASASSAWRSRPERTTCANRRR